MTYVFLSTSDIQALAPVLQLTPETAEITFDKVGHQITLAIQFSSFYLIGKKFYSQFKFVLIINHLDK